MQINIFEKHLAKKGYSNLAIEQYHRKVKEFLKCKDVYSVQRIDHEELKEVIIFSEYCFIRMQNILLY